MPDYNGGKPLTLSNGEQITSSLIGRWTIKTSKITQTQQNHPNDFYHQPCWLGIWSEQFDTNILGFWGRVDEVNALKLLSYLEQAGLIIPIPNTSPVKYKAKPTFASELKLCRLKFKPPVPGTENVMSPRNTLVFFNSCQKLWQTMRILQSFSIGQLQACSDVSSKIVRTVVAQLYQLGYIQTLSLKHKYFNGNEDTYQLVRDTGAKAPLLCADGISYDPNIRTIYLQEANLNYYNLDASPVVNLKKNKRRRYRR
ncbi:MAG: hypothetical protein KME35_06760 [Aphanocapsa sp. GSE-SYN-MK-11-07L]|nr:hypothetical protein [Aphanocapsa sp. GSE-SYN-MK-11-07L]